MKHTPQLNMINSCMCSGIFLLNCTLSWKPLSKKYTTCLLGGNGGGVPGVIFGARCSFIGLSSSCSQKRQATRSAPLLNVPSPYLAHQNNQCQRRNGSSSLTKTLSNLGNMDVQDFYPTLESDFVFLSYWWTIFASKNKTSPSVNLTTS